ncbi:hypothetical protein B0H10DRAFT_1833221 [Mycena sp. CBHHK59/15]|nr:hypothetical protein B0H10DRAFT_1833221 [Mycena sp. CBHHK59/15]
MFSFSIVMFILATMHLAMNCYRMISGYVDFRLAPGGPVGYIGTLSLLNICFSFATQSIVGDAAAVYRCWILWSRNYRVIIISTIMLIASTISGYMVCGLYSSIPRDATVFDPRLTNWITTFYSIAVAQNISTTGLMAWRLWQGEKNSARYRMGSHGSLMPVLRILVESAALYLFVEILLLSLYAVDYNAQYILLECVTPIVGFTFSVITIRINLHSQRPNNSAPNTLASGGTGVQMIGSVPMRPIVIGRRVEQFEERDSNERFKDTVLTEA